MRFNDDARRGNNVVRKNVMGERLRDVLPAKSFDGEDMGVSCGPNRCILIPITLNNGL